MLHQNTETKHQIMPPPVSSGNSQGSICIRIGVCMAHLWLVCPLLPPPFYFKALCLMFLQLYLGAGSAGGGRMSPTSLFLVSTHLSEFSLMASRLVSF